MFPKEDAINRNFNVLEVEYWTYFTQESGRFKNISSSALLLFKFQESCLTREINPYSKSTTIENSLYLFIVKYF